MTMTTALALRQDNFMLGGPLGSLDQYIQSVGGIPVLSAEEEYELATRLRDSDDLEAGKRSRFANSTFKKVRRTGARPVDIR
jgi:DNA-directed RNA polymerase sigma subunit (sigma70/sigma32)